MTLQTDTEQQLGAGDILSLQSSAAAKGVNLKEQTKVTQDMAACAKRLSPVEFFERVLKSPRYIVAPMVEQSELAWRVLSRRYGAQLCYTPMIHAKVFTEDPKYRREIFSTNAQDRPLIVQFCANDPETLLRAARMIEGDCDAIDINLGCPQDIARRGRYGSYLQDEWDLIAAMVKGCAEHLSIPVTAKIRVFPDVSKTVQYARMIEAAGVSLLTVHGRVREQKGHCTGLADWTQVKAVKEALSIPVLSNGNVLYHEDIARCLEFTGADGVMTAEGNLYNPTLFVRDNHPYIYDIVEEYLAICLALTPPMHTLSPIRAHLFKLYKPAPAHPHRLARQASPGQVHAGF